MNGGSVARRYAKALLSIAVDTGEEARYGEELGKIAEVIEGSDLAQVLTTPQFSLENRKAILQETLRRMNIAESVFRLMCLLLERRRINQVGAIRREYGRLADEQAQRVRVKVKSATPLASATVNRLRDVLGRRTGKAVVLTSSTDPELIGGLVAQIGSLLFDGSIRTRLAQLKEALLAERRLN